MPKVLIIEDNPTYALVLKKIVSNQGIDAVIEHSGEGGRIFFRRYKPDLVLLDNHLPDDLGLDILQWIKEIHPASAVIMITSHGRVADAVRALKNGALDYIEKSSPVTEIASIILHAVKKIKRNSDSAKTDINMFGGEFVAVSPAINESLKLANMVAATKLTVLLEGETGTGKEVFARYIHDNSKVSKNNFIAVDCGAIPDTLFESEMFGHEKGSFTGANASKKGKFELADNGTIFLDEIGNLPANMQVKLLRVLEERQISRIGGQKAIPVNFRLIAASNVSLEEKVKKGEFKEDLYFRLYEFHIVIPPLRKRQEDIIPLAEYFLNKAAMEFEKNIKGITREAQAMLINHEWKGNIRELKNIIQKAALLCTSGKLDSESLKAAGIKTTNTGTSNLNLDNNTQEIKKSKILEALRLCDNNKTEAAEMLGISRRHLYRVMEKYKLD